MSSDRLGSHSLSYQLLNALGAFGLIMNGWYHHALPSVILNVVWLAIALVYLARTARERRSSAS